MKTNQINSNREISVFGERWLNQSTHRKTSQSGVEKQQTDNENLERNIQTNQQWNPMVCHAPVTVAKMHHSQYLKKLMLILQSNPFENKQHQNTADLGVS